MCHLCFVLLSVIIFADVVLPQQQNGPPVSRAPVQTKIQSTQTLLHAIGFDDEAMVKAAVKQGADVNIELSPNLCELTLLHMAAARVKPEATRGLVASKANLNKKDSGQFTPLHCACLTEAAQSNELVEVLLKGGAEVGPVSQLKYTPLHFAARNGYLATVELLLEYKAKVDMKDEFGWTPLHWGARSGARGVVQILLDKGAKVDEKTKLNYTPLHIATQYGQRAVVTLLLEKGAKVNEKAMGDFTALHKAAHRALVDLLIEKGADVKAKTKSGQTPLHIAAKYGRRGVVKLLLEKKAPINEKTVFGLTPLALAAQAKQDQLVKLLKSNGGSK